MKKLLVLAALVAGLLFAFARGGEGGRGHDDGAMLPSDATLAQAFADHAERLQVRGGGHVVAILRDDTQGSRHQRFVLRLDSGQTVLIVHNIDLAPRIDDLAEGDLVTFSGEYIWNPQGGLVHWTHHDPAGRHADGWLQHGSRIYR
ncbi:DUF3465 domain-containing protein [Solimonas marina]|uniref:DUF3465 domain-containing protein n=1 Tax=Solimonas marina TaxID=2714601 RepID=A0A969W5X3_9GAMM|nr:DUF3465 domain-containing protein [Solimonas marina]NKF21251.1 DUF3465 domain-containing protein [Solimonas marina]